MFEFFVNLAMAKTHNSLRKKSAASKAPPSGQTMANQVKTSVTTQSKVPQSGRSTANSQRHSLVIPAEEPKCRPPPRKPTGIVYATTADYERGKIDGH